MNKKIKQTEKLNFWSNFANFFDIPIEIRQVSFSLFLFIMGRSLGGDTFFSVYVKKIIGGGVGLTLIGTLLPLIKLLVVIPIGTLNDQGYSKNLLLSGKIFYAFSALFYFFAGLNTSVILLIFAVIFNGIGSSTMYTTYRTLYGNKSKTENRSQIFGFYFSSINIAYVIGALISSWLVGYLDLEYMYLFIVIFGIISILQDGKIKDFMHKKIYQKWSSYNKKREAKQDPYYELNKFIENIKKFAGKGGFMGIFIKEIFSLSPWKTTISALKKYTLDMHVSLGAQSLVSFINYIGFLFIPLIAIEKNLSLSQIAILFAVMRIPYLINIIIGKLGDRYNKKLLISILICISAVLFVLMGSINNFSAILAISFGISLMVALLQPITSALTMSYAKPKDKGLMAGLQELVNKIGEIIGSFGFGIISAFLGMQISFQFVGIGLGVLGAYCLGKKLLIRKPEE